MNSTLPKLSYVLLSHNREKYIRAAIESAFAQDYEGELEYIFSDDCSTDSTFEIIKECVAAYKGNRRVVVTQTPRNLHLAGNTNHAVQFVTSDWIVRADDDDISTADRCTLVGRAIAANPGCSFVYTRLETFDADNEADIISRSSLHRTEAESYRFDVLQGGSGMWAYFSGAFVLHQVWSTRHFKIYGDLPEQGFWVDDVISNMRCCTLGYGVQVEAVTSYIRCNAGNMSRGGIHEQRGYNSIIQLERFNDKYHNTTIKPLSLTLQQIMQYLQMNGITAPTFIEDIIRDLEERKMLATFWRKGILNRIRISRALGYRGLFSMLRCLPLPVFAALLHLYHKLFK